MTKLWKRVKKWLIKKLDGFTADELAPTHYEFFPQQTKNIITLNVDGEFDPFNKPPQELLEDRLISGLSKQLKPYITWEYSENPYQGTRIVRGWVRVIVPNE